MSAKPKLLAISSPGGHWIQLTRICAGLENKYDIIYATADDFIGKNNANKRIYPITDVSADDKWRLIPCAWQVLRILRKEKPQAIISTGAAPGAVALWLGKRLGMQTIWIDSIANVQQISRAGRLAQAQADVFLTQWSHLSNQQTILFKGSVL
jgi:UDP-N-acetylglucosamine:LPS N-acetylglucosamine transferase